MEIALFGGSFDPPHVGHLLAAAWVLLTEPVDELWLVPVFAHPFHKPTRGSFDERVALCQAALSALGLARARVSRAEEELGGEGRTIDLLHHLHRTHPNHRFSLVMGSDLFAETHAWKSFDEVQRLARIIRVPRRGHELPGLPAPVLPEVSSTEVRARLDDGRELSGLVPAAVLEAIRAAGGYGLSKRA